MTDEKLLKEKIEASGYKIYFIAKSIGISYQALLNKMRGKTEFTASEIQGLMNLLHLDERERNAIFFALNVDDLSIKEEG